MIVAPVALPDAACEFGVLVRIRYVSLQI